MGLTTPRFDRTPEGTANEFLGPTLLRGPSVVLCSGAPVSIPRVTRHPLAASRIHESLVRIWR